MNEDTYQEETFLQLDEDIELIHKHYRYDKFNAEGRCVSSHSYGKYDLIKNRKNELSFVNIDDQVMQEFSLIQHSNGRRYLAFKVDLYGISYYDIDSREVFHYVPEGSSHDYRMLYGESFIITDIHYNKETDLIAYGGCYWAGPSEVFIGRFTNPLTYDPHLIRVHDKIDPEWEEFNDMDFEKWEKGKLVVKCDNKIREISIDFLL